MAAHSPTKPSGQQRSGRDRPRHTPSSQPRPRDVAPGRDAASQPGAAAILPGAELAVRPADGASTLSDAEAAHRLRQVARILATGAIRAAIARRTHRAGGERREGE